MSNPLLSNVSGYLNPAQTNDMLTVKLFDDGSGVYVRPDHTEWIWDCDCTDNIDPSPFDAQHPGLDCNTPYDDYGCWVEVDWGIKYDLWLVDHGDIAAYDETTQFPWIRTIYNGVDTDKFVPGEKPEALRPYKTGVALARIFPLKDILTMIRACDIVRREVPETRFIVYGSLKADPPYVEKCNQLIEELGVQEHFKLAGFHSKPHQAVWEGDINLLSSISEGFPFTVLESMSCGVPNVATDVGGVKEAIGIGDDATGIVVPPMNPEAFAEGCIRLFQDDRLRLELGRRARERVLRLFTVQKSVDQYREVYRLLVELKMRRKRARRRTCA